MRALETQFLERLATKLAGLEPPGEDSIRSRSWMTAPEIASWWKAEAGSDAPIELDARLLEGWESDRRFSELRIRPAKYPSFDLLRMWGHENVVGSRDPDDIAQRRLTTPTRFEPDIVSTDRLVFLSYSFLDRDFVLRIRAELAKQGLTPWIAEERIEQGAPIFESVRAAFLRASAKIVVLGRNALGSAWVHSEFGGGVDMGFVCDGNDAALMALLASWKPPRRRGEIHYNDALLDDLASAYRHAWHARTPLQATLEESVGGTSVFKQRPEKFKTTAQKLLFALGATTTFVYPKLPSSWSGDPAFRDYDNTIGERVRRLPP